MNTSPPNKDSAFLESRCHRRASNTPAPPTLSIVVILVALSLIAVYRLTPPELEMHNQGTILLDRHGTPIRVVLDRTEQDNRPVDFNAISPWARAAIVAVEDQRFHRHPGIDPIAILRAIGQNLLARRRISGASTLSTQVVRLSEPRSRNWRTKIIEATKALRLERKQDKSAILAAHLNLAPFGGNLVGIEAAAQWYFNKTAADLNLSEAAMLAGLPQSPARLRPDRHPQHAFIRMQHVLDRMEADGIITTQQRDAAATLPLDIKAGTRPFLAPHFADFVLQHAVHKGALATTLDLPLQHTIEQIAQQHKPGLMQQHADRIAIVLMQVSDGAILAMTGSHDYFDTNNSGMVNAALARRSPGSALKPFIYAMAIDQGTMTPATLLDDRPAGYRDINPANFDGQFRGKVTLRDALILSLNIPALKTVEHLGNQNVIDTLRGFGLTTINHAADHYGTGIAIGGAEVRLLDLVAAYATLARTGNYLPPRFLTNLPMPTPRRVLSPEAAYIITDILGGTERSHELFGHIADATLPHAAWKTGTSSAYRDAWTIAWTPDHVIGIWVGNTDGRPTKGCTGANAAAPIAADILRHLHPTGNQAWFRPPPDIREINQPDGTRDLHIAGISIPQPRTTRTPPLRITHPADGMSLRIPATAGNAPTLPLQAESTQEILYWFVNGQSIGQAPPASPLHWPLRRGTHNITCATPDGHQVTISISIDG
ncbi:MAG: penicillin-binding protein 1C [Kiritimatiellia bacterium]